MHRPSSLRPQYPNLYRSLKRRLGHSLRTSSAKGLWSDREKRLHINVLELKVVSGLEKVQGPVSKSDSVGCHGQLNSSSLYNQTRKNPLSGDVCSPVETHDMVPSLQDNPQGQAHYRVAECDG